MRFAYLVQTEAALPAIFDPLREDAAATIFHLSFKSQAPGALHLPGSTWTEGRNALLRAARSSALGFDYFIFCDDDVLFQRGGWRAFQAELEAVKPAIGVPAHPHPCPHEQRHAVYDFDAIVTAFHHDIVEDEVLLPYIDAYDAQSWWLSQYFVIHLAGALYPNGVVKFPAVAVGNAQHRAYPRISAEQFADFDQAYFSLWRDEAFARAAFRPHVSTRTDPPFPIRTAAGYRLDASTRRRLARLQPT